MLSCGVEQWGQMTADGLLGWVTLGAVPCFPELYPSGTHQLPWIRASTMQEKQTAETQKCNSKTLPR